MTATAYTFEDLDIDVSDDVFYPTETSTTILNYLARSGMRYPTALDLGCGSGIVALYLARKQIAAQVFASDVSPQAVQDTLHNADKLGLQIEARACSLLEGWKGSHFDLIVNDVSGISAELARYTPWFQDKVSCATGEDGIDLTLDIISNAGHHLMDSGVFLTPLLGLSNYPKALAKLQESFKSVELVDEREFVLPDTVVKNSENLQQLIDRNSIELKKQFGLYIWPMRLYAANN